MTFTLERPDITAVLNVSAIECQIDKLCVAIEQRIAPFFAFATRSSTREYVLNSTTPMRPRMQHSSPVRYRASGATSARISERVGSKKFMRRVART